MPHFVLDCSSNALSGKDPQQIMQAVFNTALDTELFDPKNVKVRLNPFDLYLLGEEQESFVHIFANIMQGRTTEQKRDLSERMVACLKEHFPEVPILSINIRDFEKATYFNRDMS